MSVEVPMHEHAQVGVAELLEAHARLEAPMTVTAVSLAGAVG